MRSYGPQSTIRSFRPNTFLPGLIAGPIVLSSDLPLEPLLPGVPTGLKGLCVFFATTVCLQAFSLASNCIKKERIMRSLRFKSSLPGVPASLNRFCESFAYKVRCDAIRLAPNYFAIFSPGRFVARLFCWPHTAFKFLAPTSAARPPHRPQKTFAGCSPIWLAARRSQVAPNCFGNFRPNSSRPDLPLWPPNYSAKTSPGMFDARLSYLAPDCFRNFRQPVRCDTIPQASNYFACEHFGWNGRWQAFPAGHKLPLKPSPTKFAARPSHWSETSFAQKGRQAFPLPLNYFARTWPEKLSHGPKLLFENSAQKIRCQAKLLCKDLLVKFAARLAHWLRTTWLQYSRLRSSLQGVAGGS